MAPSDKETSETAKAGPTAEDFARLEKKLEELQKQLKAVSTIQGGHGKKLEIERRLRLTKCLRVGGQFIRDLEETSAERVLDRLKDYLKDKVEFRDEEVKYPDPLGWTKDGYLSVIQLEFTYLRETKGLWSYLYYRMKDTDDLWAGLCLTEDQTIMRYYCQALKYAGKIEKFDWDFDGSMLVTFADDVKGKGEQENVRTIGYLKKMCCNKARKEFRRLRFKEKQ